MTHIHLTVYMYTFGTVHDIPVGLIPCLRVCDCSSHFVSSRVTVILISRVQV